MLLKVLIIVMMLCSGCADQGARKESISTNFTYKYNNYQYTEGAEDSVRYVTYSTFRRIGLNNVAEFIEAFSSYAINDVADPADRLRTFGNSKVTMDVVNDNSLFIGIDVRF